MPFPLYLAIGAAFGLVMYWTDPLFFTSEFIHDHRGPLALAFMLLTWPLWFLLFVAVIICGLLGMRSKP